jgi:hypothetical protein
MENEKKCVAAFCRCARCLGFGWLGSAIMVLANRVQVKSNRFECWRCDVGNALAYWGGSGSLLGQ